MIFRLKVSEIFDTYLVTSGVFGIEIGGGVPKQIFGNTNEKRETDEGEYENPEYWLFTRGLVGSGGLHQFLSAIDLAKRGSRSGQSGADPSRLRKTHAKVDPMAIRQAISSQWS